MEESLKLIVLEKDAETVQGMIAECEKEYEELMKKETGREIKCKLELDASEALEEKDLGGVVLTTADGRIVCRNTVASKLRLSYDELLPKIRSLLFPNKPQPAKAP